MKTRATRMRQVGSRVLPIAAVVASIFATAASQGAQLWRYEAGDMTTMFQDANGITAVTAVEQPVGLMLDKASGLTRGSELVTNGDFASGTATGWTSPGDATIAVVGGQLQVTAGSGSSIASFTVTGLTIGRWYEFKCLTAAGTATPRIFVGTVVGASGYVPVQNGVFPAFRAFFCATTTSAVINASAGATIVAGTTSLFDNFSLKAVAGNHRHQPTSTARPVLSARWNRLLFSEDLTNFNWTKAAGGTGTAPVVTGNFGLAPDGTTTAARIQFALNGGNTTADISRFHQAVASPIGGAYTHSVWLKTNDGTTKVMQFRDDNAGTVSQVINVTGTWQFFTFSGTSGGSGTPVTCPLWLRGGLGLSDSADILAWHPQFEWNSSFKRYQRINAATDYDAAGFPSYLRYDGVDDCLFTPGNVDFTNTDKITVVTGIQKNSDAAAACVMELSSSVNTNNSAFYVFAPASIGTNIGVSTKGTTAITLINSSITAPARKVVTLLGDISAPFAGLRIDGALTHFNSGSQGTGSYGSYPMYWGRRANTSAQWNGQEYISMGFGKKLSPDDLLTLERYAAGVTQ